MTFWDDNATPAGVFNVGDMYDEYTRRQAGFIVEQLDVTDGVLLDLGCGIGRLAGAVMEMLPDVEVVGSDPSWPMLGQAVHLTRMSWHAGRDLSSLTRSDFDGAWCVLTFQHLPDTTVKQHLRDLFEILKPGARLVTQWVTSGQEAPMSHPRRWWRIRDLHYAAGFDIVQFTRDTTVTDYADDWLWVTAEKPA